MTLENDASHAPSPARLEAFSDGVIAVVVTIMVLNLKDPASDGLRGLRQLAPDIGIYLVSFAFTGIYWLNHQHMSKRLTAAGYWLQIANLGFLFCLSLLPFSTHYMISHKLSVYGVQQYAATLALAAFAFYLVRLAVHSHLKARKALSHTDILVKRRHFWSVAGYLLAIPIALWTPRFALAFITLQMVIWAVPGMSVFVRSKERNVAM